MKTKWLTTAPPELIEAYEKRKIGVGREILQRLLSDERMKPVWAKLTKQQAKAIAWTMLWGEIASAKQRGNRAALLLSTRQDERDKYKTLAGKFAKLAKEIENGPLDLPLYEYLPKDVLKALHVQNWEGMHSFERDAVVPQMQSIWPTAPELLSGLEARAQHLAEDAMNRPRPDERNRGAVAARTFIWHLAKSIAFRFGKPLTKELGAIATVVFKLPDQEVYDSKYVGNVLKPKGKKGAKAV